MFYSQRVFCGQLTLEDVGRRVLLAGWVDASRDHGGLIFIHLRDRSGIVQIVFSPEVALSDVCRGAAAATSAAGVGLRSCSSTDQEMSEPTPTAVTAARPAQRRVFTACRRRLPRPPVPRLVP